MCVFFLLFSTVTFYMLPIHVVQVAHTHIPFAGLRPTLREHRILITERIDRERVQEKKKSARKIWPTVESGLNAVQVNVILCALALPLTCAHNITKRAVFHSVQFLVLLACVFFLRACCIYAISFSIISLCVCRLFATRVLQWLCVGYGIAR